MHTYKYKIGDEVTLTDAANEYLANRGYRKFRGTAKVAYLDVDWKGVPSYSLDFGEGYEMESDRLMFYAEDVDPVVSEPEAEAEDTFKAGDWVLLRKKVRKALKEQGYGETNGIGYVVKGANRVGLYAVSLPGISGKEGGEVYFLAGEMKPYTGI